MGSPKPLAHQLGYWIRMCLLFKPNVTCRPTQNLWFVNMFSTFRRRNSMVKNLQLVGDPRRRRPPPMVQLAQWLIQLWLYVKLPEHHYLLEISALCRTLQKTWKSSSTLKIMLFGRKTLQKATFTMAGSWCNVVGCGGSQTWRSLMSVPLNMIYSNTSSLGGTGRSVGLSSVPNERTENPFAMTSYWLITREWTQ